MFILTSTSKIFRKFQKVSMAQTGGGENEGEHTVTNTLDSADFGVQNYLS